MPLCGHLLLTVTIWSAIVSCQKPSSVTKRHDVYIAGFFPYTPREFPESRIGRGVMPAVKLAVEHINDSPQVLRNYRLHMWWNDTKCNAAVGVKAFFDFMHEQPHKLMLFGAASTQVTDPIAKASKYWHLTQLSYADTDPMFTSSNFPNFFRMVPSENAFNTPRIKLLQHFNWTRVGTIYQNEPRFSLAHNNLLSELDSVNVTVVESQSLTVNVSLAIERLKEKDVRIILGNFNETWAKKIFCEASRVKMYGRKYQWLIMGTYSEQWWAEEKDSACPLPELAAALEGTILTDYLPLATNKVITISGYTPEEYKKEYDRRRNNDFSRFHGYTYDGIWAAALAIQTAAHRIKSARSNQTIIDFQYRDTLWETLFIDALKNTSFEGVTGPVRFYNNERKANILLKQFQSNGEYEVAQYNGLTELLDLNAGEYPIRWKDGRGPPKDRTLLVFQNSHVNFGLYFTLVVFAIIGIITATVFLIINIKYRNQRYIKMSSPYLNNLIIIGCILTYMSVIFLGLDSSLTSTQTFPYICAARAWLLMSGFSLAFGAMFSKTWRVHSIFTDVKLNKKVIKDVQLFMVVGVLLVLDVCIMTSWQITDPFYRETKNMESFLDSHSEDIQIIPVNEYCQSNKMTWFVGFIYAYKGLLLIFGTFLAWETRHVSIPALNDSKYVGMSVYNVVLMCVMGAAISFVLSDQQNYSFGIISVFILFCSTITLCLVFVPKVVELRRNPQGSIDKRIRATLRPASKTRRESSEMEEHYKDAKATNQKYRKMLQEKDNELQNLLHKFNIEERAQLPAKISNNQDDMPQIRKEVPSATETTELSSGCSVNSTFDVEPITPANAANPVKKKATFATTKLPSASADDSLSMIKETESASSTTSTTNSAAAPTAQSAAPAAAPAVPPRQSNAARESPPPKPSTVGTTRRRSSLSPSPSAKQPAHAQQSAQHSHTCSSVRRTSMPAKRNTPAFVHQDELWLTQRQCKPKCLLNDGTPPPDEEEKSVIQRSVSEKSRDKCNHQHHRHHHHHHHHHHHIGGMSDSHALKKPTPAHVQSTPNVLGTALSDEKLVDLAILPIFQKLLTERRGAAIASCPNIAIKCDIVEYL